MHIHSYTYKPIKLAAKCASKFMEKILYMLAGMHLSTLLIQRSSKEQLLRATQDKLTNSGLQLASRRVVTQHIKGFLLNTKPDF